MNEIAVYKGRRRVVVWPQTLGLNKRSNCGYCYFARAGALYVEGPHHKKKTKERYVNIWTWTYMENNACSPWWIPPPNMNLLITMADFSNSPLICCASLCWSNVAHTLVKKYHPPLLETGDTSASKETCRFNGWVVDAIARSGTGCNVRSLQQNSDICNEFWIWLFIKILCVEYM